jgi:cytidyltransferase-like protein
MLVSSIATCDSILAKMCNRPVFWWMPVLTGTLLVFSFYRWKETCLMALFYHGWAVRDVKNALKLPLLTKPKVVYTDGVFDMCHVGHFNLLRRASLLGDKLIVAMGSDKLCSTYKRKPLMSQEERKTALLALPWPTTVLIVDDFNASVTPENLSSLKVDIVAHGEEYDPELNIDFARKIARGEAPDYYKPARDSGLFKIVPLTRTAGISTSNLIRRVLKSEEDLTKRADGGPANTKNE